MDRSKPWAFAQQLGEAAVVDDPDGWGRGLDALDALDGRGWLLVDQAARSSRYPAAAPASGVRGWLGESLNEPSGFVAIVTSFHVDGRFRQRAVEVLATMPSSAAVSALTVRLLDHAPQVRERAWVALRPRLGFDTDEAVLDVLLAGASRQAGAVALDMVRTTILEMSSVEELAARLRLSGRRRVRRWAFERSRKHELLTVEDLVAMAQGDSDQWVRAQCAEWLMGAPDPSVLVPLLRARSVEARMVALTRVPDADLSDRSLSELLVDRAPRIREQARWRARRRGFDALAFYRSLATDSRQPRLVAAALDGLASVGGGDDLPVAEARLTDSSPRVRASAVSLVGGRAEDAARAVELLAPTLLDPSARVSSTAARVLARLGAQSAATEDVWTSPLPSSRRAAWLLMRSAGGWDRVEADLRAAADTDQQLSGLGRTGIRNWLEVSAASTWQPLGDLQRQHIADLLEGTGLSKEQQRVVAFHAGIRRPANDAGLPRPDSPAPSPNTARHRLRFRLLRRQ